MTVNIIHDLISCLYNNTSIYIPHGGNIIPLTLVLYPSTKKEESAKASKIKWFTKKRDRHKEHNPMHEAPT